jgi:YD repeat-containing protein
MIIGNHDGRLTSCVSDGVVSTDDSNVYSPLATLSYSYNAEGQVLTATGMDLRGTNTDAYGYDAAGQLTSDNATDYTYDSNGNPTNSGNSIATGNELATDGTYNYTYDGEGNLIERVDISTGQTTELEMKRGRNSLFESSCVPFLFLTTTSIPLGS